MGGGPADVCGGWGDGAGGVRRVRTTGAVASAGGLRAHSLETLLEARLRTQTSVPSKVMPLGLVPTANVPKRVPSLARSLLALLLPVFVTQTLVPSKTTPCGPVPTPKLPRVVPSLARSFMTVLLP